ncbi:MAG: hypothetical protein OER80_09590 [Gammaproteobacteria bacterium]|nr:hypothetical protein [Gammaproteobacteria bacterium]
MYRLLPPASIANPLRLKRECSGANRSKNHDDPIDEVWHFLPRKIVD